MVFPLFPAVARLRPDLPGSTTGVQADDFRFIGRTVTEDEHANRRSRGWDETSHVASESHEIPATCNYRIHPAEQG
jgi:hypothetical protein